MSVSLVVLTVVFLVIAVRQIGNVRIHMWQAMLGGAAVVLLAGEITPRDAMQSINIDVMLFLFGMFVVGQALEASGYLAHVSYDLFKRAQTRDALLLFILFGAGLASAFLMNDTLAIIGTPVMLLLARKHGMNPKTLLLALCVAVTIGSAMSPIGNPQNLLIALNGSFTNPFASFVRYLFVPTILNLGVAFWLLKRAYRNDFHNAILTHSQEPIRDHKLAILSRIALGIIVLLVIAKILIVILLPAVDFRLTYIALAAAFPILIVSPRRWIILRQTDWQTLIFFAAMFVLMESVWQSGFFQQTLLSMQIDITSIPTILVVSTLISQFISNVPLVALFQPMLLHAGAGAKELLALAAGSTIAGNLFILGAASNVIIIQNAEKRSQQTVTFWEFTRVGIPLTILNLIVCWLFLLS